MPVSVYYQPINGSPLELSPAPFISKSFEPVDAGAMRLGYVENYEVNGLLYGGTLTTQYDTNQAFNSFSSSPGILSVSSDGNSDFFRKTGFVVSFSIPKNSFKSSSGLFPYSLKFKTFDTLNQIKDPSFEYSFSENEDRSVGLSVKISAQGLVSIYDAQSFVEEMSSTYNLTGFTPIYITTAANWSLLSSKKTIDRTKFVYSLERSYRCSPSGYIEANFPFSETTKVSQKLSPYGEEYPSFEFDTNLKILADSSANYGKSKSWSSFESSLFSSKNYLEEIATHYIKRFGPANLDNFLLNNISISKNSGAQEVSLKFDLLSGKSSDFKGHFSYSVTTNEDLSMGERSINLDGEFVSKGDLTNKRESLEKWMENQFTPEGAGQAMSYTSGPKLYDYVKGLTGIANGIFSGRSEINEFAIDYNSGLAQFKLSCSLDNNIRIVPGSEIKFSVDVQASAPIYKFIPAANIEGHYIIQDLQCKTAETAKIGVNGNADSVANLENFFATGVKITSELFNNFVRADFAGVIKNNNYITIFPESLSVSSGLADASFSIDYGVMYSGNKEYNHNAFRGIPGQTQALGVIVSPASIRNKHLFGR